MPEPSQGERLFGTLVRFLLPADFRERHGQDLTRVFGDLLAEARATGFLAIVRVWLREVPTLVSLAVRLRKTSGSIAKRRGVGAGISLLDIKLGVRMLAKQPALTLVAVFALAIAIPVGLVPEHFTSAIEAPLPVEDGERIRALRHLDLATSSERPLPLRDFEAWRTSLQTFGELGVTTIRAQFNVILEDGRAAPVAGAVVTASAFDILRVRPLLGRTLVHADEQAGGPDVVVIGYELWQSRLGGRPDVLGTPIRIAGSPHEIVGVMPRGFEFPFRDRLWLPLRIDLLNADAGSLGSYQVFGRLSPDATVEEARTEITTLAARQAPAEPGWVPDQQLKPQVVTFAEGFFGLPDGGFKVVPAYLAIQVLTLLLLAVACSNIGMLVFAKTAARTSELAVRTALGASRARVVTQLFTEALVFAALATGTGLLIADRVSIGFDFMTQMLPYWADLRVGRETVVWAISLAVVSAGLVSVVPALKVTGASVQQNIQRAAAGRSGIRFGGVSSALIIVDVMLAVVAIGVAVGLSDVFTQPTDSDGIASEQFLYSVIQIPRLDPTGERTEDAVFRLRAAETQSTLKNRLEAEPGVRGVAIANVLPGMDHPGFRVEVEDAAPDADPQGVRALRANVDIGYFEAMDRPLLSGRGFGQGDLTEGATAVIANTDFVERVLGGRNALGQRVRYRPRRGQEQGPWYEIVGVVGSLGMNEAMPGRDAGLYHPIAPGSISPIRLAIHLGSDPEAFAPRLRTLARETDPSAIVLEVVALDEVFSFNRFSLQWIEIGAFTLIGILLALSASGIFALMSFTVVQRTREIGVRAALGADTRDVAVTVARRSVAQLAIGILLGMPIAWRLLFELKRDLDRIPDHSPLVLAMVGGIGVLVLVGFVACVIPTRRALRITPTEALRSGS